MASKRKIILSELTYHDVMCPICLSILIEPVTMPCAHSLCMPCFNQHVSETSLACPLCRMRISVWVRRNTKSKRLINTRLWQAIKERFSSKVEARLQGVDDSDEEEHFIPEPRVCAPGELRQEYEALVEREQKELASRRSQEEELSNKLIQQLQEEEKMKLRHHKELEEHLCKEDEVLAQQIKEAENIVLQDRMKQLELLCGSDEEIARRIEKEERTKSKLSSKVSATPAKGPMDVYLGQKTPKSQGKLIIPDVLSQPSSRASQFPSSSPPVSSKTLSTSKTASEYKSTPTSSISGYFESAKVGKKSSLYEACLSRNNSGSSCGSTDSKFGRQLREITSSQSSESESEELQSIMSMKRLNQTNSSGKENVSESTKFIPSKYGSKCENSPNKKKSKSKEFKARCINPDTEELMNLEEFSSSYVMEDSDETDIEDDPECKSPKKMERKSKDISRRSDIKEKLVSKTKKDKLQELQVEEDNNCSMDYALLFTDEEMFADSMEKLKEEQVKLEERLHQEEADRLFALELQSQLNQELRKVNRSRGSADEYALRNRRPVASTSKASRDLQTSPSVKRERQTTLTESMAKRRKKS